MNELIRKRATPLEGKIHRKVGGGLLMAGLLGVSVLALAAGLWFYKQSGLPVMVLGGGISLVSLLAALTVYLNGREQAQDVENASAGLADVKHLFEALPQPTLFVREGQPLLCNLAYYQLAELMGVQVNADIPPPIERLFARKGKLTSAALFRLYHTKSDGEQNEETIRTLDANSNLRNLRVRVSAFEGGQVWQIEEVEDSLSNTALMTRAPVGLCTVTDEGVVLEINDVLNGWLGMEAGQIPTHLHEFIENPGALLDSPKIPGRIVRTDTRLLTQKDVVSPVVMMGSWHEMETGNVYASIALYGHSGLGQPIVKTAASDVGTLDDKDLIRDQAPFGVLALDSSDLATAHILKANSAALALLARPVGAKTAFSDLFVDDLTLQDLMSHGINLEKGPVELQLKTSDAGRAKKEVGDFPVDVYFSRPDEGGCTAYIVDISARKKLENQLLQNQKMQSIGSLAGGIAHEFNNLLQAIRLNTDELLGRHPVGDPSYPELQTINQNVARASAQVRKLLAFSRQQTLKMEVLDVTETLSDLTVLLKQVMHDKARLEIVHGRNLDPIKADKHQLETVLMNLCINARDAMSGKGYGTITVKSLKVTDDDIKARGIDVRPGRGYVRFDVVDTGVGMDKETQAKIFEPFFTTKEQGKGTGLGLATVYGIVQQSGGHLFVESEPGKGTTFSVYIPNAPGETPKKAQEIERIRPTDLAGSGTLLFVEDEGAVRTIAAKTLRKRGYEVVEAKDGEEAYEILQSGGYDFDLMISDVVMPAMDGPTLLKKGRDLLGNAKIVFISGYAEEEFSDLLAEEPDVSFLPKPFTLVQLAEKVKMVLEDDPKP